VTAGRVRIGGASGAWGDSPGAVGQLLSGGVDYLVMDYLAEVTMSLLARRKLADPVAGWVPDAVGYLAPFLPELVQRGVKVVTNGGGLNPEGCRRALAAACAERQVRARIAIVTGDDLLPLAGSLRSARTLETGGRPPGALLTANAYLGALPIRQALAGGADIVVTGRCADSAMALGILMHEHGWSPGQYDLLAAGSLAGHLLECGPQATGGLHTDWDAVPGWEDIGYPIASCARDGTIVISKPPGTGGLVDTGGVAQQVLYEVADPARYLLPDVTADFSGVSVEQLGPERVKVSGATGRPPTGQYKVLATYQDGLRAVATLPIVGARAAQKAERTADALLARSARLLAARGLSPFTATHTEVLGAESSYGQRSRARESREVLLRLVVGHDDEEALRLFAREIGSAALSFAPGITGSYGGRPRAVPLIKLCTFLADKSAVPQPRVQIGAQDAVPVAIPVAGEPAEASPRAAPGTIPPGSGRPSGAAAEEASGPMTEVPLRQIAYARSGDKGDSANIAIIARRPGYLPVIRAQVTADRVAAWFAHLAEGPVTRYEAPGLHAVNFVLERALGGGGLASPRIDPQGKAYAEMALELTVTVPAGWRLGGGRAG